MESSHAIEVDVQNPLEIAQIFDAISYLKGSSCIRMLSSYLGTEAFFEVLHRLIFVHIRESAYIWKVTDMETRQRWICGMR